MDVAYNHNSHANRRKKHRASTNVNDLSLAPLTTWLPPDDDYDVDPSPSPKPYSAPLHTTSYLQPKSAPTTPRLLTHSPARIRSFSRPPHTNNNSPSHLPKSKSTTNLNHRPQSSRRQRLKAAAEDRSESLEDWLLRTGALISTKARESAGHGWLATRGSTASLAALAFVQDQHVDDFSLEEQERRWAARDAARGHNHHHHRRHGSQASGSGLVRVASSRAMTPGEKRVRVLGEGEDEGDYFGAVEGDGGKEEEFAEPDFVNLDYKLEMLYDEEEEEVEEEVDTSAEDEAYMRRLLKKGNVGAGAWLGNLFGLGLLSLEKDGEEGEEEEDDDDDGEEGEIYERGPDGRIIQANRRPSSTSRLMRLEGVTTPLDSRVPPPQPDDGGWKDAAWLLAVAARALF
ncbi:hypothetical protein BT67DRAFT_461344 [Trichocladium antarcticum]|uniref:Uncharacterized protein n=1 Tax=Trichocladium antarcticum TaxID=1450529 RepID=A0AAN6UN54_9PEZI|nr:hypothetical protein BT67DRAFT_461344 [Trichocladium antarcticum]